MTALATAFLQRAAVEGVLYPLLVFDVVTRWLILRQGGAPDIEQEILPE